ncbi:MAG TPA: 30S ribosomal protein S14 [Oligoflexia bacterium]|nr:30S ribosomal protein S14 [Oligoflexia bacterium]HMP47699.1 30S ribosomal protein S14 [Oligoflexia bacterium]
MAKKSRIEKNNKRIRLVKKYATKRAELKETIRNPHSTWEEREEAKAKLQGLPRNSSAIRVRNRCFLTGRSRGFYRKFGLSRSMVRLKALEGLLPGVTKASW